MSHDRAATLRAELEDRYDLRDRTATVAGRELRLTQVRDIDELLDRMDVLDEDERLPYWAELWPSALALAELLLTERVATGRSCVEIGCGLGLVGLAAALSGGRVTLTDYDDDALRLAELNLRQNGVTGADFTHLDWRTPSLGRTFDVVLAADVLYERRSLEPVLGAVETLLSPSGTAWIAEPHRQVARAFLDGLAHSPTFSVRHHERFLKIPGDQDYAVGVWELSLKARA